MITCSLCDFQAFSKGNLTFHLNSVHFKDKEFMCRLCHFKTAYKGALTRHVNSVHLRTGKSKECPICGYITHSLLNLNSHLSVSHHLEIATAFARPSGSTTVNRETGPPRHPNPDGISSPSSLHCPSPNAPQDPHQPLQPLHTEILRRHHQQQQRNLAMAAAVALQQQRAAVAAAAVEQQQQRIPYNHLQQHEQFVRENAAAHAAAALQGLPLVANRSPPGRSPSPPPLPLDHSPLSENSPPDVYQFECRFCDHKARGNEELLAHYNVVHGDRVQIAQRMSMALEANARNRLTVTAATSTSANAGVFSESSFLHMKFLRRNHAFLHSTPGHMPVLGRGSSLGNEEDEEEEEEDTNMMGRSREDLRQRHEGRSHPMTIEPPPAHVHSHSSPLRAPSSSTPPLALNLQLPSPHQRQNTPPSSSNPSPPECGEEEYLLKCRLCHFQATTPSYLKNHVRTAHLDEVHTLSCPVCEYTSDHKADMEAHVDLEHIKGQGQGRSHGALVTIE